MNEEKDLLENEVEETTPEVTEEVIEEAVPEILEETAEEMIEEVLKTPEEALEEVEEIVEKAEMSKTAVAVVSAAITFALCVIIVGLLYFTTYNSYNANKEGYVTTLTEMAELNDMSLKEFKAEWGLPSSMKGDTTVPVAQAYIPTGKYIELASGMTFEQFAEAFGITEEDGIDEETPWGYTQKIMNEKSQAAQEAPETEATEGEATEGEAAEGETDEQEPVHPDDAAAAE